MATDDEIILDRIMAAQSVPGQIEASEDYTLIRKILSESSSLDWDDALHRLLERQADFSEYTLETIIRWADD